MYLVSLLFTYLFTYFISFFSTWQKRGKERKGKNDKEVLFENVNIPTGAS